MPSLVGFPCHLQPCHGLSILQPPHSCREGVMVSYQSQGRQEFICWVSPNTPSALETSTIQAGQGMREMSKMHNFRKKPQTHIKFCPDLAVSLLRGSFSDSDVHVPVCLCWGHLQMWGSSPSGDQRPPLFCQPSPRCLLTRQRRRKVGDGWVERGVLGPWILSAGLL